jgi:hypothetical protein
LTFPYLSIKRFTFYFQTQYGRLPPNFFGNFQLSDILIRIEAWFILGHKLSFLLIINRWVITCGFRKPHRFLEGFRSIRVFSLSLYVCMCRILYRLYISTMLLTLSAQRSASIETVFIDLNFYAYLISIGLKNQDYSSGDPLW